MRLWFRLVLFLAFGLAGLRASAPAGAEVDFNVPAQSADRALLVLAKQAQIEILFSSDALRQVAGNAVIGHYSPQQALEILLRGTPFVARQTGDGKWIIAPTGPPTGTITGKVLAPDGSPARRVRVTTSPASAATDTDDAGVFTLTLPPATYALIISAPALRPVHLLDVPLLAHHHVDVGRYTLQRPEDPTRLDPFVVSARSGRFTLDHSEAPMGARTAAGNLDLARTESDALPYMIFNRTQIARSGTVTLNEFLQRELIDSSADQLPADQNPSESLFTISSTNLSLRGYKRAGETVILVNGRPLPEVVTSGGSQTVPPDVNVIPLSLVEQVEVLPVSASSMYTGSAIGGVINIVLRPDVDANTTEVRATYTNALHGYDAPQSTLSLLHAQSLLKGALRVRLNASFTAIVPPTEAELGFHQRRDQPDPNPDISIYRATPNIHSIRPEILTLDKGFEPSTGATAPESFPKSQPPPLPLPPLAALGSSPSTSVLPGADGSEGLRAFQGRDGVRNFAFFDSPGRLATSIDALDFPYGRQQQRSTYYGSVVYDVFPWLQLGIDATYSHTVATRGLDVFSPTLTVKASSPVNPFRQDVVVSLNETAPKLGDAYTQSRFDLGSVVGGALLKLPREWRLALDSQYSRSLVKYRQLAGANTTKWEQLIASGAYNPFRDTQVYGPPQAFYDQVLIYRGGVGRFVTLGDYEVIDLALRATNEHLPLPTGSGVLNVGTDFRRNHLAKYREEYRYADGTLDRDPTQWGSRTLDRYSFFGELRAPLYPEKRLPTWLRGAEADLAVRYVASSSTHEANVAPTYGVKLSFPGGVSFRGSISTASRFPTPTMSRQILTAVSGPDTTPANQELITDYLRHEQYRAAVNEVINPDLRPEQAVTQTAGLIFERGKTHRLRAALDAVVTHKVNELVTLDKDAVTANESFWPERVIRATPSRDDPTQPGLIQSVQTGTFNLADRESIDWTASLDYRWTGVRGGTFEAYSRVLYFQRYAVRTLPETPMVNELTNPNGVASILKYRANFGASWSGNDYATGFDAHYFHSRLLPQREWQAQGHDRIRPFWQLDVFQEVDLARWLPWSSGRYDLRLQARINNVLNAPFPKYVNEPNGAGVQPYGDWRGRTYSLSLTARF